MSRGRRVVVQCDSHVNRKEGEGMLEITVQPDGEKIKSLRTAKKWTQAQLAEKVGFNKRTIENAEAGKRVKETYLAKIAKALGVPPHDLVLHEASVAPFLLKERDLKELPTIKNLPAIFIGRHVFISF